MAEYRVTAERIAIQKKELQRNEEKLYWVIFRERGDLGSTNKDKNQAKQRDNAMNTVIKLLKALCDV